MILKTVFRGNKAESLDLIASIAHQCSGGADARDGQQCTYDTDGVRKTSCAAHLALIHDQRFLDGILWMRRIAQRLRDEEFADASPRQRLLPYPGVNRPQCSCGCR